MTVHHYYSAAWRDISDYVESINKLPLTYRNRDLTLRTENITLTVAITIRDSAVYADDFKFSEGDQFCVKDNSANVIWSGEIEKSNYNYREDVFVLNINSALLKLRDVFVETNTMNTLFTAGDATQYWTDYLDNNSVQCLWAMQCCFTAAGLTLNVPAGTKTFSLFSRPELAADPPPPAVPTNVPWRARTLTMADLYFDENQLYCLGKPFAISSISEELNYRVVFEGGGLWDGGTLTIVNGGNDGRVNAFDFVSECLTSLGLVIKQYNETDFQLIPFVDESYTIDDGDKFEFSEDVERAEREDVGYSWSSLGVSGSWEISQAGRSLYRAGTKTDVTETKEGEGNPITMMTNFRILFADDNDYANPYSESVCEPNLDLNFVIHNNLDDAHINPLYYRYRDRIVDFSIEEILADYQSTYKTIQEHYVDPIWENSEIKQEL